MRVELAKNDLQLILARYFNVQPVQVHPDQAKPENWIVNDVSTHVVKTNDML